MRRVPKPLAMAAGMWLLLLLAMMANGFLRVLVLQPRLGEQAARQAASGTGMLIVLVLARLFVRSLAAPGTRQLLAIGLLWLLLTLAFEFGFGRLSGASWDALLSDYDVRAGRLWPFVLLTTLLAPWLTRPSPPRL